MVRNTCGRVALALLSAGWLACSDAPGTEQPPALIEIVPAGDRCPNGGVEFHYGHDRDRDGTLDTGEREGSAVECELVRVDEEPTGANCAFGGRAVRSGMDQNGDGTLQDEEIEATQYVCDGAPAPAPVSLVRVDAELAGANCAFGGRAVHGGVDANGNAVLDDAEIDKTEYVCNQGAPAGFTLLSRYRVPTGTAAEIVAVSPDDTLLAYTDSALGTVTFLDVSNPTQPVFRDEVVLSDASTNPGAGQPTSVAFTPDGRHAVVAVKDTTDPVNNADPGALVFIDTRDFGIVGSVAVGVGPDSVAITPDGTRAIVAIEDEEDTVDLVAQPQARPGSVQVVTIDAADLSASTVQTIALPLDVGNNQPDPQPEYVGLSRDGATAVVSLQENNALAVIDLLTAPPSVKGFIDAGVVQYLVADLIDDDEVVFTGSAAQGRREPDGVCVLADGAHVVTANEGDTGTDDFVLGQLSGGRGFSIVNIEDGGKLVFESGAEIELLSATNGMYPDSRSDARGIEVEGCHVAEIGGRELAFLTGERSSAVYVYDVTEPESARLLQLLPAPMRPESAVTFGVGGPHGALLAVAGEGDAGEGIGGGIWIFRAVLDAGEREQYADGLYRAISGVAGVTLGSVSGAAFAGSDILAVPDRSFAAARIWRLAMDGQRRVRVVDELRLVDGTGAAVVGHDPEGLAVNPEGGFVLATEGRRDNGGATGTPDRRNQIQFYDDSGQLTTSVDLPDPVTLWPRLPADGSSGVAVVDTRPAEVGGVVVYVTFRRPLDPNGEDDAEGLSNLARIGAYDVDTQAWSFYFYPLEPDLILGSPDLPAEILLADIVHLDGDRFAVLERDQLDGGAAQVKRVYTFTLASGTPGDLGDPLDKTLAVDLLARPFAFDFAGVEALAFDGSTLWVANDNDGGALATFFLQVAAP
jgi:DNA-binding beta-propeller fold protein YncE